MKKIRFVIFLFILLLIYQLFSYLNSNIELNKNTDFIKSMLHNSNYYFNNEKKENSLLHSFMDIVNDVDINQPITILETSLAYNYTEENFFSYVENTNTEPRVYIYSTHPTEEYDSDYLSGYNISPGVILASNILKEKLNNLGINTIVEEKSVADYLKNNNLNYNYSYVGSREFVSDILNIYPNLDLIIDLHRDATTKEVTTTSIDGVDYARVMFVQNTNYKDNYDLANSLSEMLNNKYPNISRGLYTKHSGKFNQDLNSKMVLLELGGNYNKIEEVVNTIDALVETIKEKLNER